MQDPYHQFRERHKTPSDPRRVFPHGSDDLFWGLRGQQSRSQFRPELVQHNAVVIGLSDHD